MGTGPIAVRRQLLLLGFMGCGKTTVGQLLARRLDWEFLDLDAELEQRQGRTINQIFAESGEGYFRQEERCLLQDILQRTEHTRSVVALGGGTFAQPDNCELIRSTGGITVWMDCPLEELRRRCRGITRRPLLRDPASFRELYQQRLPYYQKADFRVDAARPDASLVVEEILQCGVL